MNFATDGIFNFLILVCLSKASHARVWKHGGAPCKDVRERSYCSIIKRVGGCSQQKSSQSRLTVYHRRQIRRDCTFTCGLCNMKTIKPRRMRDKPAMLIVRPQKLRKPRTSSGARFAAGQKMRTVLQSKASKHRELLLNRKQWRKTKRKLGTCGIQKSELSKDGKHHWPWVAAIFYHGQFVCGGTLISDKHVVSAARCFATRSMNPEKYKVVLGGINREEIDEFEQKRAVSKIKMHSGYSYQLLQRAAADEMGDDLAMLTLHKPAKLNGHVSPSCLPDVFNAENSGKKTCFVVGWGSQHNNLPRREILGEKRIPLVRKRVCKRRNYKQGITVGSKMMCAGWQSSRKVSNACVGDIGGGLYCRTKIKTSAIKNHKSKTSSGSKNNIPEQHANNEKPDTTDNNLTTAKRRINASSNGSLHTNDKNSKYSPLRTSYKDGYTWELHGVLSLGDQRCHGPSKYTVFTKMSEYLYWIDAET